MKDYKYDIKYTDLSKPILVSGMALQQGCYEVFWWNEIALGHLFLEPGYVAEKKNYEKDIIEAIQSTVHFYAQKAQLTSVWENWTYKQKFNEKIELLSIILSAYDIENVPEEVPISVVICTRDRPELLNACLTQLSNLSCRPMQVVVIENAPKNNLTKLVAEKFANVSYFQEPKPGLSFARNTGIRNATYPIIAFVDDDVQVHPLWIYRIWESFKETNISAMTGLVIASKLDTEAQHIFEKHWSFNRGYIDKFYDFDFFQKTLKKGPPVWEIGAGANMAFRKNIFDELGYFDELLGAGVSGCSEDSEMWFRILAHKHTIHYNPRAIVYHEHRTEMNGLKKQIYSYMRGFTVAALSQQKQIPESGYNHQIFKRLPIQYLKSIKRGFPEYSFQYKTIWVEMKGILSGLLFYRKYRNQFIHSVRKIKKVAQ